MSLGSGFRTGTFARALTIAFAVLVAACAPPVDRSGSPKANDATAVGQPHVTHAATSVDPSVTAGSNATAGVATSATSQDPVWMVIIAILATATLTSVALTVWLFRWRRRLPDGQVAVVPESLIELLEQLGHANVDQVNHARKSSADTLAQYAEIRNAFAVFSAAAANKDAEIARLQKGADKQSYLQFVRRFVRVLRTTESDIAEDGELGRDTSALQSLRNHLNEALQDCGLEAFAPKAGEDYRDRVDVTDNPRTVRTSEPQQDWKISKTIHSGFRLQSNDIPLVVERAVVEIFRYSAGEQ